LRQGLAHDLNVLLERELQAKKQLAALKQEKYAVDDKLSLGDASQSLQRRQQELAAQIAEVSKVGPLYEPDRFKQVQISEYLQDFIKENPQSHSRIRLNRLLLEAAYPKEIAKTLGGVYPDREMYIASPDDSQRCFSEYYADAKKRLDHDMQFPDQPKQIKPGEVTRVAEGRLTVAGQTAVMSINGLLTKVMFDANPKNEFFVEESFPLDWMYPHLTPYGVIMKINRQSIPALPDDVYQKDHLFWKQYSKRLTGDIIDYDTPVKQICDWIEKTYLRRDFNGFTGDRKFIYDDDGQKSFSKLRSSIGGIYAWRLTQSPPEYRPKNQNEYQQLLREADFTFKQAFAFCPYSPEAVFRYANLLMQVGRLDDALLIAETCLKLDPFNGSVQRLLSDLEGFKEQQGRMTQARAAAQTLEDEVRTHPTNFQAALELAQGYLQAQQPGRAAQLLEGVLKAPGVPAPLVAHLAQMYFSLNDWPKLEASLEKLTQASPDSPEAWYDLASCRAKLGKTNETLDALGHALDLNAKRRKTDPNSHDLLAEAAKSEMFAPYRQLPAYQKLFAPR